jgi:probable HAF family extracellular repeat protein
VPVFDLTALFHETPATVYVDACCHMNLNNPERGFLLDHGRLTRIDIPGAMETRTVGLNDRGQVVGEYTDADGRFHGFLWDKGRFTTIDGPDGTGHPPPPSTIAVRSSECFPTIAPEQWASAAFC